MPGRAFARSKKFTRDLPQVSKLMGRVVIRWRSLIVGGGIGKLKTSVPPGIPRPFSKPVVGKIIGGLTSRWVGESRQKAQVPTNGSGVGEQ